jgi:hypothetical protein
MPKVFFYKIDCLAIEFDVIINWCCFVLVVLFLRDTSEDAVLLSACCASYLLFMVDSIQEFERVAGIISILSL